jgi:hypothetical protein
MADSSESQEQTSRSLRTRLVSMRLRLDRLLGRERRISHERRPQVYDTANRDGVESTRSAKEAYIDGHVGLRPPRVDQHWLGRTCPERRWDGGSTREKKVRIKLKASTYGRRHHVLEVSPPMPCHPTRGYLGFKIASSKHTGVQGYDFDRIRRPWQTPHMSPSCNLYRELYQITSILHKAG